LRNSANAECPNPMRQHPSQQQGPTIFFFLRRRCRIEISCIAKSEQSGYHYRASSAMIGCRSHARYDQDTA
jgi:hypothetical protein